MFSLAKTYVDEIVGGDGKRRYNLVRDDGSMAAQNVQIVKAYTPEQEGSTFGAVDVYDLQCKEYTITLTADGWVDGQQTVSIPEIQTDAGTVFVSLPAEATLGEMGLVGYSGLKCIGRSEGALIFSCLLGEPSTDINVNVVLTGGQPSIVNAIGGIGADEEALYVTELITTSQKWTVPEGVTEIEVRLFGGGGGGYGSGYGAGGGGGGGGFMAYDKILVTPGTSYNITIGAGGYGRDMYSSYDEGDTGGTTSFGKLLSAGGGFGGKDKVGGDGGTGGGGADSGTSVSYGTGGSGSYGGAGGGYTVATAGVYGGASGQVGIDSMHGIMAHTASELNAHWLLTGGGGGGYKANGGNADSDKDGDDYQASGGGGGGFMGGHGGDGYRHAGGGGGGYGSIKLATDGAGNWGKGGTGYGAGGGGNADYGADGGNGAPGICIIKYRKF